MQLNPEGIQPNSSFVGMKIIHTILRISIILWMPGGCEWEPLQKCDSVHRTSFDKMHVSYYDSWDIVVFLTASLLHCVVKEKEDLHPDVESQGMNDDTFCEYRYMDFILTLVHHMYYCCIFHNLINGLLLLWSKPNVHRFVKGATPASSREAHYGSHLHGGAEQHSVVHTSEM